MTGWHADETTLRRWIDQSDSLPEGASVEQHLLSCRTGLLRLLAGVLGLAALMYALAVVGGWGYPVVTMPGAAPVPIAG